MCQPRLIKHTKQAIQEFLNFDAAGCAGDIERIWMGPRDVHRHIRLACHALLVIVVALPVIALLTLRNHGIELSFMITYGLISLAVTVLAIVRLLFA